MTDSETTRPLGQPSDPNSHAGRLERWLERERQENKSLRQENKSLRLEVESPPEPHAVVVYHPDVEAMNELAGLVIDWAGRDVAQLRVRYGIAGDFLAWLDEHRPAWRSR